MMSVLPGDVVIAKNLVLWFVYCIVVALCAAYIAAPRCRRRRAKKVFQFAAPPRSSASRSGSGSRPSGTTARGDDAEIHIDGLVYALVTAGVFAWLWPR
jgi:hypothetical protein